MPTIGRVEANGGKQNSTLSRTEGTCLGGGKSPTGVREAKWKDESKYRKQKRKGKETIIQKTRVQCVCGIEGKNQFPPHCRSKK